MSIMYKSMMRHNSSVAESDKLGAVLCKDTIDNYTGHNSDLKDKIVDLENVVRGVRYDNATLRDEKTCLKSTIAQLKQFFEDSQTTVRNGINEHNQHTHQLYARIEYLEAINRGLEQDIENLRIANALYRKRWSESELVHDMSGFHGMRSQNFERLVKGYHGMLKRIGKTIIITLPFEQESVARNAEKYIVGLED